VVEPRAFTGPDARRDSLGREQRHGTVAGLLRSKGDGAVRGVELEDGEIVEGDAVVIALGPWSMLAARWLGLPAVFGYKGHSLVFDAGGRIQPQALFLEYREARGELLTPELFARADGTVWCLRHFEHATAAARSRPGDGGRRRPCRVERMCKILSPVLAEAPIVARQACFRPVTEDGLPLIGQVPGVAGAYVATGHSVWGMLNAPATGEAMSELLLDGAARHVDLGAFAPGRLPPLDPARLSVT
jgi:glycine/D-amino acid oxidase-like deaminating enzyme